MNTSIAAIGRLLASALLMTGCCPVGKVQVNPAANTPPKLSWVIAKESPGGGSSTETLTDDNASITAPADSTVSVMLQGEDSQTGIKTLTIEGAFGFHCKNADGKEFIGDGVIPEQNEEFPADANNCALIKASRSPFSTGQQPCRKDGETFLGSSYGIEGKAVNQAGASATKRLTVKFEP